MPLGHVGVAMLVVGLIASLATIVGYGVCLARPQSRKALRLARLAYAVTALSVLTTFLILGFLVYNRRYVYDYVFQHTGNDLHGWFRFAATWAGQEGSFLLWASWTALIGFLVFLKAGKYEARVMPFYVSILAFLCAILLKQSPFHYFRAEHSDWTMIPPDGAGLSPSLVNYWMTIHPPTIFFGFSSLAVPFCYAIAGLIWKDYEGWALRVMPYSLLSCATLGLGLFMGGYWAYETLGWHGFWAWDPVENASFFPWLAITGLVHGLVVQKDRGGMGRTNTFLGFFAFTLFLLGTFLTRSGALSGKGPDGQDLSIHAFDNISKSGLILMITMLAVYGGLGFGLWLWRLRSIPTRQTTGEAVLSRDFAFFLAVLLMILACISVTLGATSPLFRSWMHMTPSAPQPAFYNKVMIPLTLLAALLMGIVPWLAWRKTDTDKFLRKLLVPWLAMLAFGFFLLFWVQGAERAWLATADMTDPAIKATTAAWIHPSVQRMVVVSLGALGFLVAFSNAMLAYRVFRSKPLAAGGWLAHVGIGVLIIGVIVSNTYERTKRINVWEGKDPVEVFGYKIAFEKMTGKTWPDRPMNPDYDRDNTVQLRITPPGADDGSASSDGSPRTFVVNPRWFVYDFKAPQEDQFQRMRWPYIQKYALHDLYFGFAADPVFVWNSDDPSNDPDITMKPGDKRDLGPYRIGYYRQFGQPGQYQGAHLILSNADKQIFEAQPVLDFSSGQMIARNEEIPGLPADDNGHPATVILDRIDPATKAASFRINLPGYSGLWLIPLEVTYKPWINLVWIGVLIAVSGILLAMLRRTLEARQVVDLFPLPGKTARPERRQATSDDPALVARASETEETPTVASAPANSRPGAAKRRKGKQPATH